MEAGLQLVLHHTEIERCSRKGLSNNKQEVLTVVKILVSADVILVFQISTGNILR